MSDLHFFLSDEEALVLFDFISRFCEGQICNEGVFEYEKKVVFRLLCILESKLSEPFDENYEEILRLAREKIMLL